jgi:hypothetical protein
MIVHSFPEPGEVRVNPTKEDAAIFRHHWHRMFRWRRQVSQPEDIGFMGVLARFCGDYIERKPK